MSIETFPVQHPLIGDRTIRADELWTFPQGLIGLPTLQRFARIPLEGAAPFELLCALDQPNFGVVLVDPHSILEKYDLALDAADLDPITVRDPAQLEIRVSVILPADDTPFSVNLKGPILLSPTERVGIQRISPSEDHPVRLVLSRGAASCSS
jgi:flagellar assembly factor FliW